MSKMIFVNFPVRDLDASLKFYEALGGTLNPQFSDERSRCVVLSESIYVMLLNHERYAEFTKRPIGDAKANSYALIALGACSRDEVHELVEAAAKAGGRADPNPMQDLGFMLNRNVEDPDGNVWEIFHMDMAGFEAAQAPAG
jgi:predicted lactoylglutathione lyase